jgi:hypothetical protein
MSPKQDRSIMSPRSTNTAPQSSVLISALLFISMVLGFCDFSHAGSKERYQAITKEEFTALQRIFSKNQCDANKLQREIVNLNLVVEVLDLGNSGEKLSFTTLSEEDLCLISLGSSFQTYSENFKSNAPGRFSLAAERDIFPVAKKIIRIEFFLPRSLTPKTCFEADQVPYPYIFKFSKIDGVLIGTVYETDTPSECFFAAIKKKNKF